MKLQLAVLGLLIGVVGCGPSIPSSDKWQNFHSPAGYSVSMPNRPQKETQHAHGDSYDIYLSEVGKDFAVLTTAIRFPEEIDLGDKELVRTFLDEAVTTYTNPMKAKVTEKKEITVAGKYPGREFGGTFNAPEIGPAVVRGRIFLTKKMIVILSVVGTEEYIKLPQAQKFLESVRID